MWTDLLLVRHRARGAWDPGKTRSRRCAVVGKQTARPAGSLLVLLAALGSASSALAQPSDARLQRAARQADPAERYQVDPSLAAGERTMLDFGGFATCSFLTLDDASDDTRTLLQPEVALYARAVIDGVHEFFVRTRFQYRDYVEGESFDGRGDRWTDPFLERYWYEFDLRRFVQRRHGRTLDGTVNVRGGRLFVDWGAGLTLSQNIWGAKGRVEWGQWAFDAVAGVTPGDSSVVDFDASRKDYQRRTWRAYYGGMLSYRLRNGKEFYGYYLYESDHNRDDEPTLDPFPFPVQFEYDAQYLGVGANGPIGRSLLYVAEFVYEFGQSMSDPLRAPGQPKEDINAWAARAQLSWLFHDRRQSAIELEALFASGDDDRFVSTDTVGGNAPGTRDTAFNSLGFVNTGLAFAGAFSNLIVLRAGGSTSLLTGRDGFGRLQVGVDLLNFFKFDADGGIDEPTDDDRYIGFETDVYANYRITSDLAITARYGIFFPGDAILRDDDPRHFVFLGATLSF